MACTPQRSNVGVLPAVLKTNLGRDDDDVDDDDDEEVDDTLMVSIFLSFNRSQRRTVSISCNPTNNKGCVSIV